MKLLVIMSANTRWYMTLYSVLRRMALCVFFFLGSWKKIDSPKKISDYFRECWIADSAQCLTWTDTKIQIHFSVTQQKRDNHANYCLLLLHLFSSLFSSISWVSLYQKGKTSLDLNKARDDQVLRWQWHQLDHMQTLCTSLQADNHTNTSLLYKL